MEVGNFISGSSGFSKSNLNIWRFTVHILLKPGLDNFEHYFVRLRWVQLCGSLNILWHCSSLGLQWKPATIDSPNTTLSMSVVAPAAYKERMKRKFRYACYSAAWKQTQTTAANGLALSSLAGDHSWTQATNAYYWQLGFSIGIHPWLEQWRAQGYMIINMPLLVRGCGKGKTFGFARA